MPGICRVCAWNGTETGLRSSMSVVLVAARSGWPVRTNDPQCPPLRISGHIHPFQGNPIHDSTVCCKSDHARVAGARRHRMPDPYPANVGQGSDLRRSPDPQSVECNQQPPVRQRATGKTGNRIAGGQTNIRSDRWRGTGGISTAGGAACYTCWPAATPHVPR